MEQRILLLALRGRDASVIADLLGRQGHECLACASSDELAGELAQGAGAAMITEESLVDADRGALLRWLEAQPPWSDFPFILLATKRGGRRPGAALLMLHQLGNVIVLERPIHGETLTSAVDSALRARRRQYEARKRLDDLQAAEERLQQLNTTLESRIEERTHALAKANDQLMQEVAERERAQAALVQSQKMEAVGQLTGGIAHDFNNLLTVIGGNLELIQRRVDDEKLARLTQFALHAADRAAKLTRQLLAFSRTQRLTLKPVDINALVLGMDDLLDRTIGPRISIRMMLDETSAWAMADANQVELAVLNLVINARDAMTRDGVIRIVTDRRSSAAAPDLREGDYLVLAVCDNGVGIAPHLIEKVFDPFFTTKPLGKGTGLGLSQVYGIAQQSGGTVRITSTPGEGTTVEIWLPVSEAFVAPEVASAPLQARADGPRKRVLVIEDDAGVRRFMVECLEMLGYAVVEAAYGREGLERLAAATPELMIVDYAMPGMNGVEVVTEARLRAPDLRIILATGYADMEAVDKVIEADRVLRKPFQIDDLDAAVRAALA
ncbi:MAG: response regulator [Phenylobacterium sp.]|uniref:ATP-binding protein n=1 Tax=Phenylobacterium sp. TaxID=1871053 RepID=UPI00273359B0|nr:ATP-binding protein [Phenylobacterium sp.]MDP3174342.1 response regulator [Phenylobacterium sp.]